jgi:hypothetical protein
MRSKFSTISKLYVLIFLFLVGFGSLLYVTHFFTNLSAKLDKQIVNYENKIKIGEFIAEDIQKLRAVFYSLGATTS